MVKLEFANSKLAISFKEFINLAKAIKFKLFISLKYFVEFNYFIKHIKHSSHFKFEFNYLYSNCFTKHSNFLKQFAN